MLLDLRLSSSLEEGGHILVIFKDMISTAGRGKHKLP